MNLADARRWLTILVRECDRAKLKDVKVIQGEACITQHRLLVRVAQLGAKIKICQRTKGVVF